MILDQLDNASMYESIHAGMKAAFAFLRTLDLEKLKLGKSEIIGEKVFAMVNEYTTKPTSEGFFEAHRRYIDIQFMLQGRERIGFQHLNELSIEEGYNFQKDFALYKGTGDYILVNEGFFMILFPHEGHKPGCYSFNTPEEVRKVVVKVLLEY